MQTIVRRLSHRASVAARRWNIRWDDFVLELGSGHNPKARADVLCDISIDDNTERGGSIVMDRPIIEADGQYLPFADKTFDSVICSHVLEHAENPGRFISELTRVASRGYLETPSELAERMFGWPFHRHVVNLIDGQLTITKKICDDEFGNLFHALVARDKHFARFVRSHRNLFLVQYEWDKRIEYRIVPPGRGALDVTALRAMERLVSQAATRSLWEHCLRLLTNAISPQRIRRMKSLVVKGRGRARKGLREIVVCPMCKRRVVWECEVICCLSCDIRYPIVRGIPRLLPPRDAIGRENNGRARDYLHS